jgi:hypothetical protein
VSVPRVKKENCFSRYPMSLSLGVWHVAAYLQHGSANNMQLSGHSVCAAPHGTSHLVFLLGLLFLTSFHAWAWLPVLSFAPPPLSTHLPLASRL